MDHLDLARWHPFCTENTRYILNIKVSNNQAKKSYYQMNHTHICRQNNEKELLFITLVTKPENFSGQDYIII